ncbi:MAG: carbohydrate ABC transporter permease [Euzebya sp.]
MGTVFGGILAIALGVGGAYAVFWVGNFAVDRLVGRSDKAEAIRGYVFILPAMFVVGLFLVYPLLDTIRLTFFANDVRRGQSRGFVGLDNYVAILGDHVFRSALWNNILWMIVVPAGAVIVGLAAAVLADNLKPRWEKLSKSMIFLPMAISFVGASVVWDLIYDVNPPGTPQTGILNAIVVGVFGGSPIPWLERIAYNDFAMMAVMIWLQAGFAMVLLSAAIKSVPEDTIEAARIDGASETQVFFRIVVPQIQSTIVVVLTTILILVLKVFDIVRVLGRAGQFNTDVIANAFYTQFVQGNNGSAGVYVVVLVILTIPFMILNIRRFREQEALR